MPEHTRVLLVDADVAGATALIQLLGPAGYEATHASSLPRAAAHLADVGADVVLLSLDTGGLAGVTRLASAAPEAELVLLAGAGQVAMAREGLRLGACDVVERTGDLDAFLFALERAAREGRVRREVTSLRARMREDAKQGLVGRSPNMVALRELVARAAASRRTVLITGEPGTGKDVVARLVHDLSDRAERPYVVVRCEGTTPAFLADELFGTSRGGLLEAARGGTLVLDEPRCIPRALRERLAAMLSERVVRRAGADAPVPVDVRLIFTARVDSDAPPLDMTELLGERNALPISIAPLRERRSDIPLLVQHFRGRAARARGAAFTALTPDTMSYLMGHEWPGNVRELEHWLERVANTESLGESATALPDAAGSEFALLDAQRLTLEALERKYILHVLRLERGHQSRAADRLGIDRRTLYRKLKEYREEGAPVQRAG